MGTALDTKERIGSQLRVSVVITAYNYAEYLPRAIESVLGQSCVELECMVVDDGSEDETESVVRRYLADPRMAYRKRKRGGQAAAKNDGVRNTRGEFVAFLDADDWWHVEKLERQLPLFAAPDIGVVYGRMHIANADESLSNEVHPRQVHSGRVTGHLLEDNFIPFSSAIVRRACLEHLGGFNEDLPMGIDWDLWLRMSVHYQIIGHPDVLMYYRRGHVNQMSRNMETRFACADRITRAFLAEHGELLSSKELKNGRAYSLWNRAEHYRETDLRRSNRLLLEALVVDPSQFRAYKGLAKNVLTAAGLRRSRWDS